MRVYKDIEWLEGGGGGKIPAHWEVKRLRHIFKEVSIKKCGNEQQLCATQSYGVIPKKLYSYKTVEVISSDLNSFKLVKKDNFVISLRSFEGGIEHSNYQGIISPAYTILEPQVEIYSFYFKFLFKSSFFISTLNIHKIGIREGQNISYASLQYTPIPLPPLQEQKEIAEFLDKKCEKIQNYIDKKQKLITLLQEKKQALINEVVTKGLNPNIEFKNSDIEYLGLIPHHWEVRRMKFMASIHNGREQTEIADENGIYPIYGSGGILGKSMYFIYDKPSVLLGRKGTIDKPLFVEEPFWTIDTMFYTSISKIVLPKYFYYLCLTIDFQFYISGSAIPSMTQYDLANISFALPPLQEQKQIANFLDEKCEKINSAIEKTKRQIELIKEYKNTLINEAVCGRINFLEGILNE
ncbi:restriction endonuclease subunit S [Campylobacter upsaliensis]